MMKELQKADTYQKTINEKRLFDGDMLKQIKNYMLAIVPPIIRNDYIRFLRKAHMDDRTIDLL